MSSPRQVTTYIIAAVHKDFDRTLLNKCGNVIPITLQQLENARAGEPLFDSKLLKEGVTNIIHLIDPTLTSSKSEATTRVLDLIDSTVNILAAENRLKSARLLCCLDFNNGYGGINLSVADYMKEQINTNRNNLQFVNVEGEKTRSSSTHPVGFVLLGSGGGTPDNEKFNEKMYKPSSALESQETYNYRYIDRQGALKQIKTAIQLVPFANPGRPATPSSASSKSRTPRTPSDLAHLNISSPTSARSPQSASTSNITSPPIPEEHSPESPIIRLTLSPSLFNRHAKINTKIPPAKEEKGIQDKGIQDEQTQSAEKLKEGDRNKYRR